VINGAKTFITGGMPGFTRGRELEKMGCKVQDTAELSFVDVRVPAANLLGDEGEAFGYLGHNLPQERLTVAVGSVSQARSAIAAAIDYTKGRKAFGTPVASFQNTKFELAACSTEVEAAQAMVDRAVTLHVDGDLSAADAPGEVVLHRDAGPRDRPLPATVRRLRLHDGAPDRPALHGRPGGPHLRRDQPGHEGDHRQVARPLTPLPRADIAVTSRRDTRREIVR
jgi:hypothetical protein